jgi:hypothetical protein
MSHSIARFVRAGLSWILPKPRICEDLEQWALDHNIPSQLLHEPIYDEIAPILGSDERGKISLNYFTRDFKREQRLFQLDKAKIRLDDGILILPDGSVCQQGMWYEDFLLNHPGYSRIPSPERQNIEGACYSLLSKWGSEYFHWFHDVLPRLYTSLSYLPEGISFLINSNPKPYQIISLEALGINPKHLIEKKANADTFPEKLYFATPLGHTTGTAGELIKKCGQAVVRHVHECKKSKPAREAVKRLWITRKDAKFRKILNEDQLLPILDRYGFVSVTMEALTWEDQISLLYSTEYIVGLHGAGLMNILFAPSLISLGEIGFAGMFPCYKNLATQCGVNYSRLVCEPSEPGNNNTGVAVDPDEFEHWLAQIVAAK